MEEERKLNADISGSISEFQAVMKEFLLKYKLYRILLRGKGLEFETYRNYAPDDDAASIDWKASKRANNLLVKQYRDERNLKIMFLIDVGENMIFGSSKKLKCEYAAEVIAAFSHLIITSGDKAGFILFSDRVKDFSVPSGGKRNFQRFMDNLTKAENYGGPSNINKAIDFVLSYLGKNIDSVVMVSDFISFNQESEKKFSLISSKFETVALVIRDPLDNTLPEFSREVVIQDPKTGQQLLVNPKLAKSIYEQYSKEQENKMKRACLQNRIDILELMTNEPFVPSLSQFLKGRTKKK